MKAELVTVPSIVKIEISRDAAQGLLKLIGPTTQSGRQSSLGMSYDGSKELSELYSALTLIVG